MKYKVYLETRWLKSVKFCGGFFSLQSAQDYVVFLQQKFPSGKKIVFKIEG